MPQVVLVPEPVPWLPTAGYTAGWRPAILRFVVPSFFLLSVASIALAQVSTDPTSRLPRAYIVYCQQLTKEGRADELTMNADQKLDSLESWYSLGSAGPPTKSRWFGPKDSTWTQVDRQNDFSGSKLMTSYPVRLDWEPLDPKLPARDVNEDCRNLVAGSFQLAPNKSILFTVGHAMESCTETPLMFVYNGNGESKYPLPDLFGYNTQALWYTGTYLILNIKVEYEYGETLEGLAFWNLEKGWIHSAVAETHAGVAWGDEPPRTEPTSGLGVLLRDLQNARLSESNDVVLVEDGSVRLAFWPATQEWQALQ